MRRIGLEVAALAAVGLVAWVLAPAALQGLREAHPAQAATALAGNPAARAALWFSGGVLAACVGRLVSLLRQGEHLPAFLILPGAFLAAALGLGIQCGTLAPAPGATWIWPGLAFGQGVFWGGLTAGVILALPLDLFRWIERIHVWILAASIAVFVALGGFGHGPGGTRINLLGIQPLEVAKVGFVLFLAVYMGRRAGKIRWQRVRSGILRFPRPKLLLPAVLALLATFLGLLAVRDLGPTLILAGLFLALFHVVARSPGWVLMALTLVGGLVLLLAFHPDLAGSEMLELRIRMWLHPWLNGLPHGDQVASARWALAAGGLLGQGLGHGALGAVPAGHTDLVLARVVEDGGVLAAGVWIACLGAVVAQGLVVAARNRTPERVLVGAGLALLLIAQVAVIGGGTVGAVPLTGVVVPFLSSGRSGQVVFLAVAALLARLAEDGAARAPTDDLHELGTGVVRVGLGAMGLLLAGLAVIFVQGVMLGGATSIRGAVTTLADGTVVHRHDPRLEAIARAIPRGEIRDRHGEPLAGTGPDGRRTWPLGDDLGTLLGPPDDAVLRPAWSMERAFDVELRGWPDLADGPAVWVARPTGGGRERLLFAQSSRAGVPGDADRARVRAGEAGLDPASARLLPLPAPDLSSLAALLHRPRRGRQARIAEIAADVDGRSVQVSLDARLQRAVAAALEPALRRGRAAAAVVLDVDTGQVLARAQVPDFDPADDRWRDRLTRGDPRFTGVYGPWPDKTGLRGFFQAGSVFKLVTAMAAVRSGHPGEGRRCARRGDVFFSCTDEDAHGPMFTAPGWTRPIHDHRRDRPHGRLEITEALAVSCNVWFAQLGLALGPEPFQRIVADGLEVGWSSDFDPGPAGSRLLASTAFGQGSAVLNVLQAARVAATIGSGGVYRRCDPTMRWSPVQGSDCTETRIVQDDAGISMLLAGMRRVVDAGTARSLTALQGVRIYGKTGTADDPGRAEEAPWGIRRRSESEAPHAWFVALAEPGSADPCEADTPGRLAVAVVVPRSGTGATVAGPVALDILGAAHRLGYFEARP
ncbi:MAG: FtsW/RodA/SpoVE family cell cycle protein [Deltaproteobacteria bacterium]|nr:FtsW/RodA/SpoVE family cell cycle protein [Deltaproteobacteria bacterium]